MAGMPRNQLTRNFYLDEFQRSQTATRHGIAIEIVEGGPVYSNLRHLCVRILQPLRDALGPVHIDSGYRPPRVNRLVGGDDTSQHLYGLASDILVPGHSPLEVACWIRDYLHTYDQLIHEYGQWVHVSIAARGRTPRMQCLTAVKVPRRFRRPKTVYVPGLWPVERALKRAA